MDWRPQAVIGDASNPTSASRESVASFVSAMPGPTGMLSGRPCLGASRARNRARDTLFEPATLCGSPVVATKVLAFNFELR
jgi:hypothetical protein